MSDTGGVAGLAEPPSRAAVQDIVTVAEPILEVYRRGTPFYATLAEAGEATNVELVFSCEASNARAVTALFGTLQLAVDAATACVEYVEETDYSGGEIDAPSLERLAATPFVELEIVELANGSVRGRLRFLRTRDGRGKLLNVALIASIVLMSVVSPIPSLVITGLYAANELTPDERDATIAQLQEKLTAGQQDLAQQVADNGDLRRRVERLERIAGLSSIQATTTDVEMEIAA